MNCQCADRECPVGHTIPGGALIPCSKEAKTTVYRIDMDDETGTPMCYGCASDAMLSGVFRSEGSWSEPDLSVLSVSEGFGETLDLLKRRASDDSE